MQSKKRKLVREEAEGRDASIERDKQSILGLRRRPQFRTDFGEWTRGRFRLAATHICKRKIETQQRSNDAGARDSCGISGWTFWILNFVTPK